MATAKLRYVPDEPLEEHAAADPTGAEYADAPEAAYDEGGEPRCPTCGELLAWHEEACQAAATVVEEQAEEAAEAPAVVVAAPRSAFAYCLGHLVQPEASAPGQVIWRGQLKERHPATGLVHRVNVYQLNNGYWDCYREEELQAA